jgi:hypothetical protein
MAAEPGTGIISDEKLTKTAGQENSDRAAAADRTRAGGERATGWWVSGRVPPTARL